MISINCYSTKDIGIAAYLMMNGLELRSAEKEHNGNRFFFKFNDPSEKAEKLKIDYANSDFQKYDNALRILKSMCHR